MFTVTRAALVRFVSRFNKRKLYCIDWVRHLTYREVCFQPFRKGLKGRLTNIKIEKKQARKIYSHKTDFL